MVGKNSYVSMTPEQTNKLMQLMGKDPSFAARFKNSVISGNVNQMKKILQQAGIKYSG